MGIVSGKKWNMLLSQEEGNVDQVSVQALPENGIHIDCCDAPFVLSLGADGTANKESRG